MSCPLPPVVERVNGSLILVEIILDVGSIISESGRDREKKKAAQNTSIRQHHEDRKQNEGLLEQTMDKVKANVCNLDGC